MAIEVIVDDLGVLLALDCAGSSRLGNLTRGGEVEDLWRCDGLDRAAGLASVPAFAGVYRPGPAQGSALQRANSPSWLAFTVRT